MPAATSVERTGRTALVRIRGDVVVPTARHLYGMLRGLHKRRDVKKVVLDFGEVGKLDSSGVAVVQLLRRAMRHSGKELELTHLEPHHEAAFELAPQVQALPPAREVGPTWIESIGGHVLAIGDTLRSLGQLVRETTSQGWQVATRRRRLPQGAFYDHVL